MGAMESLSSCLTCDAPNSMGGAPHPNGCVPPSAYELYRLAQIERNEAVLSALGLSKGRAVPRAAQTRRRRAGHASSPQRPVRLSPRRAGQERRSYAELHLLRARPLILAAAAAPAVRQAGAHASHGSEQPRGARGRRRREIAPVRCEAHDGERAAVPCL